MDDLLKQLTGQGGASGSTGTTSGTGTGTSDPLGGLGSLLGQGGLGSVLGGALGGGIGGSTGGGLGGLLGGGLGAMLPTLLPAIISMLGAQAGHSATGTHQLLDGMRAAGLGGVADSWVGTGANEPISASQVAQALGPDKLQKLATESGLPVAQVSEGLAAILPAVINHVTPDGTLPDAATLQSSLGSLGALFGK